VLTSGARTPKISVIIPAFNKDRFVAETIDTALAQTYPNVDITVIDDGSTDSTPHILKRYSGRLTILEHLGRANRGQSAAINLGIRSTQGDYLAILDADDLWEPTKLEHQVQFLDNHPNIGCVYANAYVIDTAGRRLYTLLPPNHVEKGLPEHMLVHCPVGCPSGYLVRRSVYNRVGYYDETLRSAQDHDMLVRLTEVSRVGYINEVLWSKREHPDSLSARHEKRGWILGFTILEKACRRYPYSFHTKRQRLAVLHYRLGQCLLREKRYLQAGRDFILAGLYDPSRALRTLLKREKPA